MTNRLRKALHLVLKGMLILALPLLLVGILYVDAGLQNNAYYGRAIKRDPPPMTFHDSKGRAYHNKDFEGKFVYLFFGFTRCPSACPRAMGRLSELDRLIETEDVAFLFITIDPEHDQGDALETYQNAFSKRVKVLRADKEQLRQTTRALGYQYQSEPDADGLISHEGHIFLLDPSGKPVLRYGEQHTNLERMSQDFSRLKKGQTT